MISLPLCVTNNGRHILGIWDQPDNFCGNHNKKVCLVCIGVNGNRVEKNRMLLKLSRALTAAGISIIRFEYTGLGVSEGDFWSSSVQTKVDDTVKIFYFANAMYPGDNIEWNLLSYSDGISIVLTLLEKERITFNKLIAWSPVLFSVASETKEPMRFVREIRTKQLVVPFGGLWLGKDYLRDLSIENNWFEKLLTYSDRAYCIFGLEDCKVKETIEKLRSIEDIEKTYIPDADHEFSSSHWLAEVIQQTLVWLTKGYGENGAN